MATVVVVDRIEPGSPDPEYCLHGRATCAGGCHEWVWLGSETLAVVQSGEALPLCHQCALRLIDSDAVPLRQTHDHRRADGPH